MRNESRVSPNPKSQIPDPESPFPSVPLLDLVTQHESIADDVLAAVEPLIREQRFILGEPVDHFEAQMCEWLGMPHAVGCASGTDAILLALRALDVGRGDEVVTSPFTFFATAGAIHNVGARPVFADIEPRTFNLDAAAAAAAVTAATNAVMPVHLFGQMADMAAFTEVGRSRDIPVIEDAAQAVGARQQLASGDWITAGEASAAATLSFFPSKNLGGWGDGGMIITKDGALAERLRRLRVHGGRQMYQHEEVGYNSRLDALQAAVLAAKLPRLAGWSAARRSNAEFYTDSFDGLDEIVPPFVSDNNESIFNQYTIRVLDGRRDELAEVLRSRGIGSGVYYPVPLHLQECFAYLGYSEGDFPVAERASREVLSLPVFPELAEEQRAHVAASVRGFFA